MITRRVMVTIALGAGAMLGASCGGRVICDYAPPADTVTGRLVQVHHSVATFEIERVEPPSSPSPFKSPPALSNGDRIVVHYSWGETRFLHVGSRYRVTVWWNGETFASGVHEAGSCSTGTVYADGSAIDTSWWRHLWLREIGEVVVFVFAVLTVVLFLSRRREVKRQRRERIG